jgi:nucleoside-diphosphate-sugar epimerase
VVTGSEGYLGRAVVRRLRTCHSGTLITVDRRPAADTEGAHLECDLGEAAAGRYLVETLAGIAGEPLVLVHLAALFVKDFAARPRYTYEDYHRENAIATQNLVAAMDCLGREWRMVFASTAFLYHQGRGLGQADPLDAYARSKLEAERIIEGLSVPWTILRPARVLGLSAASSGGPPPLPAAFRGELLRQLGAGQIPFDIVSTLMRDALEDTGEPRRLRIRGADTQRSYLHLEDLAEAVRHCLATGETRREKCDLTASEPTDLAAVGREVVATLGRWGIPCELEAAELPGRDMVAPAARGLSGWRPACDPSIAVVRRAAGEYAAAVAAGLR